MLQGGLTPVPSPGEERCICARCFRLFMQDSSGLLCRIPASICVMYFTHLMTEVYFILLPKHSVQSGQYTTDNERADDEAGCYFEQRFIENNFMGISCWFWF